MIRLPPSPELASHRQPNREPRTPTNAEASPMSLLTHGRNPFGWIASTVPGSSGRRKNKSAARFTLADAPLNAYNSIVGLTGKAPLRKKLVDLRAPSPV